MPAIPKGILLKGAPTDPRGRSIVAARAFRPGEVIATFGSPSVAIPDSPHLTTTCSGCLTPANSADPPLPLMQIDVRACSGCRAVAYCSVRCQRLDWTTGGHKAECKIFKKVRSEGHDALPTPVRALVHILLRPEMRAALEELEGHVDRFERDGGKLWTNMELQSMGALHYLGREPSVENLTEAIEIFCKLQVNSFTRADEDLEQTGLFLNPTLAMVNHSCVPNAFVQFVDRKAVIHAYREIQKDEEIEISYIDNNLHLSHRQEALKTRYHFICACPRCKDDKTVYQVCREYPHLHLNSLSLVPDIAESQDLQNPILLSGNESLTTTIKEIYPWCSIPLLDSSSSSKKKDKLRRRWAASAPLRTHQAYAVQPLHQILTDAGIYFAARGDDAYSLCIACFIAIRADPYAAPAPFAPSRVKGIFMIANLLAGIASRVAGGGASVASTKGRKDLRDKISAVLDDIDHTTVCQTLFTLVAHHAPAAHSQEWAVLGVAKDLLGDIAELPERENQNALIKAFMRNPEQAVLSQFFEQIVLGPLRELSGLCLDIMESEFGS